MITLSEVVCEDGIGVSLSKLIGKPVADVECMLTSLDNPSGDEVVLAAILIRFKDGSALDLEGCLGDCLLMDYNKPREKQSNMSQEVLSRLYAEES